MLGAKCRHHLRQQGAGQQLRRGHAHHALAQGLEVIHPVQHGFQVLQYLVHQRVQALAGFGQADAARAALDQAHAQGGLQFLDLPAEGRLREVQRGGGLGEAAGAHQRHQGAQTAARSHSYEKLINELKNTV